MPLLFEFSFDFLLPVLVGLGTYFAFATYDYVKNKLPLLILRPGHKALGVTPEDYGLAYEHVALKVSPTIQLDAYFVPATVPARANLIILHGVGSCKEVYLPNAADLCALGYNLFMVDQRQHGKSGGRYLTYGHHEKNDVSKMVDWLSQRTDGLKTGIYGNSMGAAVALQSMAHDPRLAFGLIESTFTDLPTITRAYTNELAGFRVPHFLTDFVLRQAGKLAEFDPWSIRPIDAVGQVDRPLQFIHGDSDQRIAFRHGEDLHRASVSRDKNLYLVPGGDHADLWEAGGDEYPRVWMGFLRRMIE